MGAREKRRRRRDTPEEIANFQPKAVHWRYLFALGNLLARGEPYSMRAWSRECGLSKNAARELIQDYPGFQSWVHRKLDEYAGQLIGPVLLKIGGIALKTGSVEHARLYLEASGRIGMFSQHAPHRPGLQVNFLGVADHVGQGVPIADWPGGVLDDALPREPTSKAVDPLALPPRPPSDGSHGQH